MFFPDDSFSTPRPVTDMGLFNGVHYPSLICHIFVLGKGEIGASAALVCKSFAKAFRLYKTQLWASLSSGNAIPEHAARCLKDFEKRCSDVPASERHSLFGLFFRFARAQMINECFPNPPIQLRKPLSWIPRILNEYKLHYYPTSTQAKKIKMGEIASEICKIIEANAFLATGTPKMIDASADLAEWLCKLAEREMQWVNQQDAVFWGWDLSDKCLYAVSPLLLAFAGTVKLNLSDNHLDNASFALICEKCLKLSDLKLSKNEIDAVPDSIKNLKDLEILWLNNNKLETIPDHICSLQKLFSLRLDGNKIEKLPENICSLTGLKYFYARDNKISLLPPNLGACVNLEHFLVGGNAIKFLPEGIARCSKLQQLDLQNNQLTHLPNGIEELPCLEIVLLEGNPWEMLPWFPSKNRNDKQLRVAIIPWKSNVEACNRRYPSVLWSKGPTEWGRIAKALFSGVWCKIRGTKASDNTLDVIMSLLPISPLYSSSPLTMLFRQTQRAETTEDRSYTGFNHERYIDALTEEDRNLLYVTIWECSGRPNTKDPKAWGKNQVLTLPHSLYFVVIQQMTIKKFEQLKPNDQHSVQKMACELAGFDPEEIPEELLADHVLPESREQAKLALQRDRALKNPGCLAEALFQWENQQK